MTTFALGCVDGLSGSCIGGKSAGCGQNRDCQNGEFQRILLGQF
jgi:hypothetical protein